MRVTVVVRVCVWGGGVDGCVTVWVWVGGWMGVSLCGCGWVVVCVCLSVCPSVCPLLVFCHHTRLDPEL